MTDILKEHRKEGTVFERLQMKGYSYKDIFYFMEQYDLNRLPLDKLTMDLRVDSLENAHIHINYINYK